MELRRVSSSLSMDLGPWIVIIFFELRLVSERARTNVSYPFWSETTSTLEALVGATMGEVASWESWW